WEVASGKKTATFFAPGHRVEEMALADDGRWLFTAGGDGIRIWDIWAPPGKQETCRGLRFFYGSWAVIDAEWRDDAPAGKLDHLHWVIGSQPMPLEHFKNRFYDPGLLAKHLGRHAEKLRNL